MEKNTSLEQEEITIDLGMLISALWKKAHIILLSAVVFALLGFVGTKLFVTPQYDSVTKIYIVPKQNENTVNSSDLQAGALLTKDYMEMIKSRPVLEEVSSVLNLKETPKELSEMITVETPADTRVLKIIVRHTDPKKAKNIADAVRESASIHIQEVMNIDAVNTVEEANLPLQKASPNVARNVLMAGMFGVLLCIGIILLNFMRDDTIKTPVDVEKYLEMNVLASIPIKEEVKKNKKGKYSKKKNIKRAVKVRR
ncbi:Wzz/FepE/Etk N-terminal domain-containing protein [Faecalimonas sp.]